MPKMPSFAFCRMSDVPTKPLPPLPQLSFPQITVGWSFSSQHFRQYQSQQLIGHLGCARQVLNAILTNPFKHIIQGKAREKALQQRLHEIQDQLLETQNQLLDTQEQLQVTQYRLQDTQQQSPDTQEQLAKLRLEKVDLLRELGRRSRRIVEQNTRLFSPTELVEKQVRSLRWERWSWEARFWRILRQRDGLSLEVERLKEVVEGEISEKYTIVDQREQEMKEAAELRKEVEEVKQELMWKSVEIRFLRGWGMALHLSGANVGGRND